MLFALTGLAAFVASAQASCLHGTTLFPRDTRAASSLPTFGYTGIRGPLLWHKLDPVANAACARGSTQSPINLDNKITLLPNGPTLVAPSVPRAEIENRGTTIEVTVGGTTNFQNKDFFLRQYHFHTPSEHRIEEEHSPLEMHMVHQATDNATLVLAFLFELTADGSTTSLITNTIKNLREITQPGDVDETGPLDFGAISRHMANGPAYYYVGSLTTPPCREGINFVVAKKPLRLNVASYNALKRVLKFNSRYTQNAPGQPNLLKLACA